MSDNTEIIKELRERLAKLEQERDNFANAAQVSFARRIGEFDGRVAELRQTLLLLDDEAEDGAIDET